MERCQRVVKVVGGAALGLCLFLGGLMPQWAAGQSVLERLETQIRRQREQAGSAAKTATGPTTEAPPFVPGTTAPRAPVLQSAASVAKGERPYLGIKADDTPDHRGVLVLEVYPGGPGVKAGLQPNDVIVRAAALQIRGMSDLVDLLELYKPNDKVVLEVQRNGQAQKMDMVLGRRPSESSSLPSPPPAGPPVLPAPAWPTSVPTPTLPQSATPPALLPSPETAPASPYDLARISTLERRVAELERRVNDLERVLHDKAKTEPPKPRLFNRAPRNPE